MLVLCVLGRIPPAVQTLAQQAQQRGIALLCITDLTSPAPTSDWLLRCDTSAHAPMVGHLLDTSAAHTLVYGLVAHTVQWGAAPFELE